MKGLSRSVVIILIVLSFLAIIFCLPHQTGSYFKLEIIRLLKLPLKISTFIANQFKNVIFYPAILKEYKLLKEEVDILTNKNIQFEEILRENERLTSLLSFKKKSDFVLIASRVIARDILNWEASFTIDKGLNDGLYLEMPVITPSGLVGWVRGVGSGNAQVMLITDINSKVAALIQETRIEGILVGTGKKLCQLKFLEVDAQVQPGQLVITSGLSSIVPKGLIIGHVKKVIYQKGQVQKIALIEPSVNFDRLEEVMCVDLNR